MQVVGSIPTRDTFGVSFFQCLRCTAQERGAIYVVIIVAVARRELLVRAMLVMLESTLACKCKHAR